MLLGGGALGVAALAERDDDGYFDATIELATETAAITAEDLDFLAEPGSPDWIVDTLDVDVRLRATAEASANELFIGIAREADIDGYLAGVAHAEVRDVDGQDPIYRLREGNQAASPPDRQDFWVTSASGVGSQEIFWEAQSGRWAAVVMNADGSPGVVANVNVGARSGIVVALSVALLAIGTALTVASTALIVAGARSPKGGPPAPEPVRESSVDPAGFTGTHEHSAADYGPPEDRPFATNPAFL